MNNGDLATERLRTLQQTIFERDTSPNRNFQAINGVLKDTMLASKEINEVRDTLNRVLSVLAKNGGLTKEITQALTGSNIDISKLK